MIRWITSYIDQNSEKWKKEEKQRVKTELERAEDWKKLKRFEKIEILREKARESNREPLQITIKPSKLTNMLCNQAEPHHGQDPQTDQTEDQAEQNAAKGTTTKKADPQERHTSQEDVTHEDQAEVEDVTAHQQAEPQRRRPSQEAHQPEEQAEYMSAHKQAEPQRRRPSQEDHLPEEITEDKSAQKQAEPECRRPTYQRTQLRMAAQRTKLNRGVPVQINHTLPLYSPKLYLGLAPGVLSSSLKNYLCHY